MRLAYFIALLCSNAKAATYHYFTKGNYSILNIINQELPHLKKPKQLLLTHNKVNHSNADIPSTYKKFYVAALKYNNNKANFTL